MAKTSWRNATIAVRRPKHSPASLTHHVPATYHRPVRVDLDGVTWYALRVRGRVELDHGGDREADPGKPATDPGKPATDPGSPHKRSAEADLHRLGLRTYCPLGCRWGWTAAQRRTRKQYPVLRPYLFVGMASPRFIEVEELASSSGFLEVGGTKAAIPPAAIRRLNDWELAGMWDETDPNKRLRTIRERFAIGAAVSVTDGAFTGFGARVDEVVSEDRIRLLIDLFGRQTPVEVDASQIEATG